MPPPLTLYQLASGDHFELATLDHGDVLIGREPENGVIVESAKVSRQHGAFVEVGTQWIFRDLGSTNGTWLNGLQLLVGQPRLLRDGDLLQLGDVRIQISIAKTPEATAAAGRSLLVFSGEEVLCEFGLPDDESQFVIGGAGSSIEIEGEQEELVQISGSGGRLEVIPGAGTTVLINGMVVSEPSSVADRDEVAIMEYQIIVNDRSTGHSRSFQRPGMAVGGARPSEMLGALETVRASVLDQDGGTYRDDWDSEAGRRKLSGNRRFVFGMESTDAAEPSVRSGHSGGSQPFEMNISQRLPTTGVVEEDPAQKRFSRIVIALGVILMVLVIGLLGFVIYVAL